MTSNIITAIRNNNLPALQETLTLEDSYKCQNISPEDFPFGELTDENMPLLEALIDGRYYHFDAVFYWQEHTKHEKIAARLDELHKQMCNTTICYLTKGHASFFHPPTMTSFDPKTDAEVSHVFKYSVSTVYVNDAELFEKYQDCVNTIVIIPCVSFTCDLKRTKVIHFTIGGRETDVITILNGTISHGNIGAKFVFE